MDNFCKNWVKITFLEKFYVLKNKKYMIFFFRRPTVSISDTIPCYWLPVSDGTVFRYLNIDDNIRMGKMLNIEERINYKKHLKKIPE